MEMWSIEQLYLVLACFTSFHICGCDEEHEEGGQREERRKEVKQEEQGCEREERRG